MFAGEPPLASADLRTLAAGDNLRPMLRTALALALFPIFSLHGAESAAARIEADYRAKRQAALSAQWMEVKLPFETPAAFLARLLDTARDGDSRATAALGWEFHQ